MQTIQQPSSGSGQDSRFGLLDLFKRQISNFPDKKALVFGSASISYAELDKRSSILGRCILTLAPESALIGLSCTPSIQMVINVLAILKSGKGFMPLELNSGAEKIETMIADSGLSWVLSSDEDSVFSEFGLKILDINTDSGHFGGQVLPKCIDPESLAYVVFTSGSAGKAKGVPVKHKAIENYIRNAIELYCQTESDETCTYFHLSLAFDASFTALFASLCSGGTMVIASGQYSNAFMDPNFLRYAPYDFLKLTPVQVFELEALNSIQALKASSRFVFGGETLYDRHIRVFRKRSIEAVFFNEYGPSETCVGCLVYRFMSSETFDNGILSIPVGFSMKGVNVRIVNNELRPVGPRECGEIVISGAQVLTSYLNERQSASGKVNHEHRNPGVVPDYYRSGDFAYMDDKGRIIYICREDKWDMMYSELLNACQLEHEIAAIDGVKNTLVMKVENPDGANSVIAYLQLEDGGLTLDRIKPALAEMFVNRSYAINFVRIEGFPLTVNKKINRKALPGYVSYDGAKARFQPDALQEKDVFVIAPSPVSANKSNATFLNALRKNRKIQPPAGVGNRSHRGYFSAPGKANFRMIKRD